MFKRILIANRGEIALRIIRACRELDIETVAVYSEADRNSLHTRIADHAVCIGPAESSQSYLHIPNIISAAVLAEADAIHPGYGYLSERFEFAEICESHGIVFIGPTSEQIEQMGDKARAKEIVANAGVPVIPGSEGPIGSERELLKAADDIGYPILLKAAAGGGGRGMRVARTKEDLEKAFEITRAEAAAAFGSSDVYLERLIERPRHIEIQILADSHGNAVHFGERECSLQRRHQKLLEEAPSVAVSEQLREQMGQTALKGAAAVGYVNAGTMEFLLDEDGSFYFMEMNTRIQVEHPVTEMVYGIDLVKEQIRIAAGRPMSRTQAEIVPNGHAIECRLNAEDPRKGFMPSPGTLRQLHVPGGCGLRWDSHVYTGYTISPFYDSMFGKLIAWANSRQEAIARMQGALEEFIAEGIRTTIPFQLQLLNHKEFQAGNLSTRFVEEILDE